jgi:hypothetical protein
MELRWFSYKGGWDWSMGSLISEVIGRRTGFGSSSWRSLSLKRQDVASDLRRRVLRLFILLEVNEVIGVKDVEQGCSLQRSLLRCLSIKYISNQIQGSCMSEHSSANRNYHKRSSLS